VQTGAPERAEFAPAKINLTLRIGRRRSDGFHDLTSLVVFADVGDELRLVPGDATLLSVTGETAAEAGPLDGNLVLKAARALQAQTNGLRTGHFRLTKRLPVAAGIGGGSSDAAAALRLLARLNDLPANDESLAVAARATGADVPVCLDPQPRIMRGIGEILSSPLALPLLHAVLVNPGVPVPTAAVFQALANSRANAAPPAIDDDPVSGLADARNVPGCDALLEVLAASANDLEAPALTLFPAVGETLDALRAIGSCRLARMSGSGGTCFGLFATDNEASEAAARLAQAYPQWWVRATKLGSAPRA
jgi:4-diphosphocytidyl-2-C-methyl-D-erythritol kinase